MKSVTRAVPVVSPSVKQERDRFVAFAFAAADMLLELDSDGKITYLDGAVTGFLGSSPKKWLGKNFYSLVHEDDQALWQETLAQVKTKGRVTQLMLHLQTKYYKSLPVLLSALKLSQYGENLYLTLSVQTQEMESGSLGERDMKSGLFQKNDFAKKAEQKIRKAQKEGKNAHIALIDFPELKDFLDDLQPEAAASLVIEIADYLRGKSLDGDTAGVVGEYQYSVVHDASVTTEQLIQEVQALTQKSNPEGKGVAPTIRSIIADTAMLTERDSANAILYTLNRFAQNPSQFTLSSLQQGYQSMLTDTMDKIAAFKHTVVSDDFQMAFQPIVDLKTGIIHHYETLVRFENKAFGNPFQFITFGEQTDLIGEFDLAMCQRGILVLEEAAKQGHYPIISVNLSGKSLSSGLFMEAVLRMIRQVPHLQKQLIFEITESAKIEQIERANNFIQELRKDGNLCCLDDFGVAESSFDYLRNLIIDFVKIDGSYVKESITSHRGRSILKAMVGMCRSLGITTIGEMIEDEKTAEILWECGVHYGQGYFFGKPSVNASELIQCAKPSTVYQGITRAKRLKATGAAETEWWKKKE
jgi:PAS domain S-box-containing protein